MAENVKRRVATARMAVAFVAAGTIAGAAAWAQASPPAHDSALNSYLKLKGQVRELQARERHFEKVVFHKYYSKVELNKSFAKHSDLNSYIKIDEADSRYIKIDDIGTKVVGGKGSVYTATRVLPTVNKVTLLDVPGKFTVDTTGPTVTITNTSNSPLVYSACE